MQIPPLTLLTLTNASFPGLGLGASLCSASEVTDGMVSASVEALASTVSDEQLATGLIYPTLSRVREVSAVIATEVIKYAVKHGLAKSPPAEGTDVAKLVDSAMYKPTYLSKKSAL